MKHFKLLLIAVLSFVMIFAITACVSDSASESDSGNQPSSENSGGGEVITPPAEEYTFTLSQTVASAKVGDEIQLTVSVEPETEFEVVWESSDNEVATVTAGLVQCVGFGEASITATIDDEVLTCVVNIDYNYTYTLSETAITGKVGESKTLTIIANPAKDNVNGVWSSTNESVATVSNGVVSFIGEGEAYINVMVEEGTALQCSVEVNAAFDYLVEDFEYNTVANSSDVDTIYLTAAGDLDWAYYGANNNITDIDRKAGVETHLIGQLNYTGEGEPLMFWDNYKTNWTDGNVSGREIYNTTHGVAWGKLFYVDLVANTEVIYYHVSLGGYKSSAKFWLQDAEGNKSSEIFIATDANTNHQYTEITFGLVASEAAVITMYYECTSGDNVTLTSIAASNNKSYENKPTLTSNVKATYTEAVYTENTKVDLTDNGKDLSVATLDWAHYGDVGSGINKVNMFGGIYPITVNFPQENGFGDYKGLMHWTNGEEFTQMNETPNGICTGGDIVITLTIDKNVKYIRLYTGAWKAVNTITIYGKGGAIEILKTEPFEAGESSINKVFTFALDVTEKEEIIINVNGTSQSNGNASLVAVTVLGTKENNKTATVGFSKNELLYDGEGGAGWVRNDVIDLTQKGVLDWYYMNFDHETDVKNVEKHFISRPSFYGLENKYWDHRVAFKWTDGTKFETSPIDNDCDNRGTNNGICTYTFVLPIMINAQTSKVYVYIGGWQSNSYLMVSDAKGNILIDQAIQENKTERQNYELVFDVNTTIEEVLYIKVYKTDGENVGFAAAAVA